MGDIPPDLNQSPTNINFNFNESFDGRWTPNGHLIVEFGVRWVNALASAVAAITPSDAMTTHSSRPSTSTYSIPVLPLGLVVTSYSAPRLEAEQSPQNVSLN